MNKKEEKNFKMRNQKYNKSKMKLQKKLIHKATETGPSLFFPYYPNGHFIKKQRLSSLKFQNCLKSH